MQKYSDAVVDKKGEPIVGAAVLVKTLAGTIATIYGKNLTAEAIANPLYTDSSGGFSFYASNGRYSLEIQGGGQLLASVTDIILYDPAEGGGSGGGEDTQLRADLANPSDPLKGAVTIGRGVVSVDSVASLLAMPDEVRRTDLRYLVKGYAAGSNAGGGEFYWDATSTEADNGCTILAVGGITTGRWKRIFEAYSPQMFGAKGDGIADDTAALQAFATFISGLTGQFVTADMIGTFKTTDTITFSSTVSPVPQLTLRTSCVFKPVFSNKNCLVFNGLTGMRQVGIIQIIGQGGTTYTTRTLRTGIVMGCPRSTWDCIKVSFAKYYAVECVNPSTMTDIGKLIASYCGSSQAATGYSLTFDTRTDAGSSGNASQTSTLHISAGVLDTLVVNESFVLFSGRPHQVKAVDTVARTITVSPWLYALGTNTGTLTVVEGGGIRFIGGDTSKCTVGTLDAFVCGIGCHNNPLYGALVKNMVAQSCHIGYMISAIASACLGGELLNSYYEGNTLDIVCASLASTVSHIIGISVALDLAKVIQIGPLNSASPTVRDWFPTKISQIYTDLYADFVGAKNPNVGVVLQTNGRNYDLHIDDNLARLFFWAEHDVIFIGTGTNGAPTGTVTFTCSASEQINGGTLGASLAFSGFTGMARFRCTKSGVNWTVTKVSG